MKHVFWLVENELCGRSGPNLDPWNANELARLGIRAVLSVNEAESVYSDELASAGLAHKCVPLAANAPPRPGDDELCLERLPIAYEFALSHISAGAPVLVHCRQGKDRTGLFMSYYLVRKYGLSVDDAITSVKKVRPTAMTAFGWDRFVPEVLGQLKLNH